MPESAIGNDSVLDQPIEIPQSDWSKFLDDFTTSHNMWTATLDVRGSDGDPDVQIRERPLEDIGFDELAKSQIHISLGPKSDGTEAEITHSVFHPTKLTILPGRKIALSIEATDGTVTVIRCTKVNDKQIPGAIAA